MRAKPTVGSVKHEDVAPSLKTQAHVSNAVHAVKEPDTSAAQNHVVLNAFIESYQLRTRRSAEIHACSVALADPRAGASNALERLGYPIAAASGSGWMPR